MGGCRLMGKRPTFILMMLLTSTFFLVEIVVGYLTNSMALVADSFHMLSDIISLFVGFFALKLSRKTNGSLITGNTFGWVRAEVLGALINAVFLVALCLSIFISALKRLVDTEPLTKPILILIVGAIGLVVNLLGMLLFHGHAGGHGHSHGGGGHGHSHGGGSHGHAHGGSHGTNSKDKDDVESNTGGHVRRKDARRIEDEQEPPPPPPPPPQIVSKSENSLVPVNLCPPPSPSMRRFQERARSLQLILQPETKNNNNELIAVENPTELVVSEAHPEKSGGQLNMRGVYLHILGDALGSVIVIIAALIVHFVKHDWTLYVDPALSIIMVVIILFSCVPLLKESSQILLQNVPPHIQLNKLENRLLSAFPEIVGIHEFHVWQLAGNKIIASVHVKFHSNTDYTRLSPNLKEFFHSEGIHSTTFQPEVEEEGSGDEIDFKKCLLACVSKSCQEKLCCTSTPVENEGEKGSTDENEGEKGSTDDAVSGGDVSIVVDGEVSVVVGRPERVSFHDNESFHMKEGVSIVPEQQEIERSEDCCCDGVSLKEDNKTKPVNDVLI